MYLGNIKMFWWTLYIILYKKKKKKNLILLLFNLYLSQILQVFSLYCQNLILPAISALIFLLLYMAYLVFLWHHKNTCSSFSASRVSLYTKHAKTLNQQIFLQCVTSEGLSQFLSFSFFKFAKKLRLELILFLHIHIIMH